MKIKKVKFKKYKRFFELEINLGEKPCRLVALVGPNGCGKSSVFDGMLFHHNAHGRIGNKQKKNYEYHSLQKETNYDYRNIEIVFDKGNYNNTRQEMQKNGKEKTIFTFRSPYRYNQDLKIKETKAVNELRLNSYGATVSSDIDDKMEENYRRLQIKYNDYMHDNDCKPSEAKTKIIGELNKSIKECLDLEIKNLGNIGAGKGSIYFTKQDYKDSFEFNVLSSGEKEVIDILLDIYLRSNTYNDSVYLIDEPELHINTAIQKKLLIEINKLVPRNCQIWIATHSIGFLRALQEELKQDCQIIEFEPNVNWASEAITLVPIKKSRENWQRIFGTALDDLTNLLAPKTIIYCEGKLKNSLDEKIFNEIFSRKYTNSLFVASTNKEDCQRYAGIALTVLNKAFDGVQIKVLIDRDDDLEKPKASSIKIIKLLRREFENYLLDFEVISNTYPEVKKEDYDMIVSDIVEEDVKSRKSELIKLCDEKNDKEFRLKLAKNFPITSKAYLELETLIFK